MKITNEGEYGDTERAPSKETFLNVNVASDRYMAIG
jgi:hypothetical protein